MSWLDGFSASGVEKIQHSGTPLPQRPTLNVTGSGATVTDDPTTGSTILNIPAGGIAGLTPSRVVVSDSGGNPVSGQAIATAATPSTIVARDANGATAVGNLARLYESAPGITDALLYATGNGSTNDFAALQTAAAAQPHLHWSPGNYKVATTGAIGTSASVHTFEPGAVIHAVVATPLTVHGQIDAAPGQQIFAVDAPGAILLPDCPVVHPGWFGAVYDNATDDGPAHRAAVCSLVNGGIHQLGAGTSRISTGGTAVGGVVSGGIVVDKSNITIKGHASGTSKLTLNPASPGVTFTPIIFHNQTSSATGVEPTRIFNVGILDVEINFPGYGTSGATQFATVQFNRCSHVSLDVLLTSDVLGQNGTHTDGVALAYECDDVHGVVRSFQTSKVAFYCAGASNVQVDVYAKDGYWNSAGAFGVQVTNTQDFDIHLQTSGNGGGSGGGGVIIVNDSFGQGAISTFTDQTHFVVALDVPRSLSYALHLGVLNATTKSIEELKVLSATDTGDHQHFTIVLATAPAQTLSNGFVLQQYYIPNKRGRIVGSIADTPTGVVIGENGLSGSMSEDITIDCDIHDCTSEGIEAANYKNLTINGHIHGCTIAGVNLQDVNYSPTVAQVAQNAVINAMIGDNGVAGIYLQNGPKGVTISEDCVIYVSPGKTQTHAILTSANSNGQRPSGVFIGRFAHPGYANVSLVDPLSTTADLPLDGLYDLYDSQTPLGFQYAPFGSRSRDQTTGFDYTKRSAGTSNTGWTQTVGFADASKTATANSIAQRDASGNLVAVQLQGSGLYNPAGGIFYEVKSGSAHLFGDDASNSHIVFSAAEFIWAMGAISWTEGVSPSLIVSSRTSDLATHSLVVQDQTPWVSATGTNRNNGGMLVEIAAPASGGTQQPFRVQVAGFTGLRISANGSVCMVGIGGTTPVVIPARAGQLTDSSGGTSGGSTIAAITGAVDPTAATLTSTANAIATLAARLNLLEGKLSAAGTGIGVTL